jgi:hypothetical protein
LCAESQLAYDGFSHFVESINASEDILIPMFTLYCDDSGTHRESDIAVAGCYIATVEQWKEVKRNWEEINARENFGVFHMADFVARKGQFASPEWQDEAKRSRTIEALISIINTRVRIGIAAAVIKSAYDEVVPADVRERVGKNHYTFAIRMCIAFIERWRSQCGYTEPIQFVFDRLSKGKGDIEDALEIAASGGQDAVRRFGIYQDGWSFQNKANVTQLQAPDIWAYENYRYAVDRYFVPVSERKPLRESYRVLRKGVHTEVRYNTKESLAEFVRRIRESDQRTRTIDKLITDPEGV